MYCKISLKVNSKNKEQVFRINVKVYLFKFIKINEININNENQAILKINNFIKYKNKLKRSEAKGIFFENVRNFIKYLKFKKIKAEIQVGFIEANVTAIVVGLISTGIFVGLQKLKEMKKDEIYYEVLPLYENKNVIKINLDIRLSIGIFKLLISFIKNKMESRINLFKKDILLI